MKAQRHLSRVISMQVLYACFLKGPKDIDKEIDITIDSSDQKISDDSFIKGLVHGVIDNLEDIREVISSHSHLQTLKTVDPLSLSILCLGVYELKFSTTKLPPAIVINEAIILAKAYGKDTAPSFINGILSKSVE